MFWKKDNHHSSLVSRLILLYSLSTIGIIVAISLFIYPSFNNIIQHAAAPTHLTIECYKNAIIALLLGSLGAIIFGYIIANKSLKKINEFSQKMRSIHANSLHERINPKQWPSELKMLGNEFNTMLNRLQQSFDQLSQFSSDISHELRNPIHHLMASTEVTLAKDQTTDDYKKLLCSHLEEYVHLSKLVDNLLFLAKADHGQLQLNKSQISVNYEIMKIVDYFEALTHEKKITLTCHGDGNMLVDQTLFRRAIANLVSNALQYTPEDGTIKVIIAKDEQNIKISIIDSGIGIQNDQIEQVFNRFYRTDSARATQSGGLGLGLAIVKSIINLHQGSIALDSTINYGTSVHLFLPA